MAVRESVDVIPGLWSMGADYNHNGQVSSEDSDPEMTILKTLKYYWTANDVFFMLYALLKYRIRSLIHVQKLVSLAQLGFLSHDELIILIAISKKLVKEGDHRFKMVHKQLYKKGMKLNKLPELHGLKSVVKVHGVEESLLEFGARVRKFEVNDKKLYPLKDAIKRNGWFKVRALMGANYRADIIYLKCSGRATKSSEIVKILGCEKSTVDKNLKALNLFENLNNVLNI